MTDIQKVIKNLTDKEVNTKLASWEGWTNIQDYHFHDGNDMDGIPPGCNEKYTLYRQSIPNYTDNLNSIHKLEEKLTDNERSFYIYWFYTTCRETPNINSLKLDWIKIHATARQRAESILLTLHYTHI